MLADNIKNKQGDAKSQKSLLLKLNLFNLSNKTVDKIIITAAVIKKFFGKKIIISQPKNNTAEIINGIYLLNILLCLFKPIIFRYYFF